MMVNLHPPLTAFPPALLVLCIIFELKYMLSKSKIERISALELIHYTTGFSILTYLSGYIGSEFADQTFAIDPALISFHEQVARVSLLLLITASILSLVVKETKQKLARSAFQLFLLLSFGVILYTANLGGELVFKHGAGVSAPLPTGNRR